MPEDIAESLLAKNIVPLCGIENSLAAIDAAASINTQAIDVEPILVKHGVDAEYVLLNEFESKQKLADFSIPIAESALAETAAQAIAVANKIEYPVVLKVVADDLAHKTELGLVKLNIADDAALTIATQELLQDHNLILVEKMINKAALELIVGINHDPVLGLYLMLGAGGIYAELLKDTAIVLFPYTETDIKQALDKLRISALFDGYRNQAAIDTKQLINTVMKIEDFVMSQKTGLIEMDINPLIVCEQGQVFAADALIRQVKAS